MGAGEYAGATAGRTAQTMLAMGQAAEGWAFVRDLRRGGGVGEGRPPSPFNPVIFSMQLEESARCLHILSVPSVLSWDLGFGV